MIDKQEIVAVIGMSLCSFAFGAWWYSLRIDARLAELENQRFRAFRLTDVEREALCEARNAYAADGVDRIYVAAIDGLLARAAKEGGR